ncbi:asparagine synthase (glutamine-hydrolyzing) [Gammaproteobacteria bacterium AH-315-C21]|nr:asparagine synthase (glutamine-hydrolyzing) [Gammaproteobacteria bacterium AH-315-C21]
MCGITGIISSDPMLGASNSLYAMTDAIQHRGPDDYGYYETTSDDGCYVGMGHRRLSIIDIDSGKQPITNEDETIFLIFNGEIYNFQELRVTLIDKGHVFKTLSDSEVIVHAYEEYGEQCVTHFRGMFAFAIWNDVKKTLYMARDRFGKKPLFYTIRDNSLLFSSEIKSFTAIIDLRDEVNLDVIPDYLAYRYVPGPDTLYKNIYKLGPGNYATYRNGVFQENSYYSPPDRNRYIGSDGTTDSAVVDNFLNVLRESVNLRMISDVPFGAFLSGGLDSTAIVALMSEVSSFPVKTFSVGFEESSYSELRYAEKVAKHFKTDHHELTVTHDELIKHLPSLIKFRDAPVSEPSDIPIYLLALEASKTVKMVLTGEGSDEILGGYPKHVFERYAEYYQLVPKAIRHLLIEPLATSLPYKFRRIKTALSTLGIEDPVERQPRWFGALNRSDVGRLLIDRYHQVSGRANATPFAVDEKASLLRKTLYFDQTSWLPDNLLERGDRMTMAASIEARMPFLDHEIAEYVSSLPDKYRVRGRTTKWVLREAMKDIVPIEILNRPKVGFRLPVNEWFRGPMKDYLYDNLTGVGSISSKFYKKGCLENILSDHIEGRQNNEKILWALLNLELWLKGSQM